MPIARPSASWRKPSGGVFSIVVVELQPDLTRRGQPKLFNHGRNTDEVWDRRFCVAGDSSVRDDGEAMPEITMLNARTLDDASRVQRTMPIYRDGAQPECGVTAGC